VDRLQYAARKHSRYGHRDATAILSLEKFEADLWKVADDLRPNSGLATHLAAHTPLGRAGK